MNTTLSISSKKHGTTTQKRGPFEVMYLLSGQFVLAYPEKPNHYPSIPTTHDNKLKNLLIFLSKNLVPPFVL
jgi:hypothetical protein